MGRALVTAMLVIPIVLDAQGRFRALADDGVAIVPNLRIVTILDTVQDACYLLFMVEPELPAGARVAAQPSDIDNAAARRDRRLAELNDRYEQALRPMTAGAPVSVLRYELDAWTIQSDFERIVREHELARIEDELQRIARAPTLAVSGPAACGRPAAASIPPR
jgi:hypothetical protein